MGILGDILRVLAKTFCAGPGPVTEPETYAQPPAPQQQQSYPPQQEGQFSALQHPSQQQTPQRHNQEYAQQHHISYQHSLQNGSPVGSPHSPSSPHGGRPSHQPFVNQNQINQNDEGYMALRAQAKHEGDEMARCFDESHKAYNSGDGARAKELSNQGKSHKSEMERLNKQASSWIFVENNKDSKLGEIDLHGLFVKEAIEHTDEAIQAAQQRGDTEVHLIVGKGLHSQNQVAKLKPAIEELMQKHQLLAELDPQNVGVLIVYLNNGGRESRNSERAMDSDQITRQLEKNSKDCIIM